MPIPAKKTNFNALYLQFHHVGHDLELVRKRKSCIKDRPVNPELRCQAPETMKEELEQEPKKKKKKRQTGKMLNECGGN